MENVKAIGSGRARKTVDTGRLVKIGMLSGVAFVLYLIEFAFPIFPAFLKMDLSDLPALVGTVSMGPVAGIAIEAIKNVLHLMKGSTAGVGELANFLVGSALIVPIGVFFRKGKNIKSYVAGSIVGAALMVVIACVFNYYILIPAFAAAFHMDIQGFVDIANGFNSMVVDFKTLVYFSVGPFNGAKAIIVALVGYWVCRVLRPLFNK